jgi:hypothetical protein
MKKSSMFALIAAAAMSGSAIPFGPSVFGKSAAWSSRATGNGQKSEHDVQRLLDAQAKRDRKNAKRAAEAGYGR